MLEFGGDGIGSGLRRGLLGRQREHTSLVPGSLSPPLRFIRVIRIYIYAKLYRHTQY